jgi:hypothetical protein
MDCLLALLLFLLQVDLLVHLLPFLHWRLLSVARQVTLRLLLLHQQEQ